MEQEKGARLSLKGSMGLIVAIVVVAILLIWLPAYRLFSLVSVLIWHWGSGNSVLLAQVPSAQGRRRGAQEAVRAGLRKFRDDRIADGGCPHVSIRP
jgi:hypothetical protein